MRALVILATMMMAIPAQAAETKPLEATYGLFTGGVRMIQVDANFDLRPEKYTVRTSAKTIGLFATMLPWTGAFETTGEKSFQPVRHDFNVRWRSDVTKISMGYKPAGKLASLTKTADGKTDTDMPDADITNGTRDMLSSVMMAADQYQRTGKCGGDILTFDGDRSFLIRFTDGATATLNNPRLSSYTGPAHACTVEVVPQKGKWPKKPRGWLRIQQQAKAGGKLPTIWLAAPKPGLPVIPVRIDIHTKYGDVIAHLTALK